MTHGHIEGGPQARLIETGQGVPNQISIKVGDRIPAAEYLGLYIFQFVDN